MFFLKVAPFLSLNNLTYAHDFNLEVGSFVRISIGKKETFGMVLGNADVPDKNLIKKVKNIEEVLLSTSCEFSRFIHDAAHYNATFLGDILRISVPAAANFQDVIEISSSNCSTDESNHNQISSDQFCINFDLSQKQTEALSNIISFFKNDTGGTMLLKGATGSGKTIVCLMAATNVLMNDNNAQVLILFPEITLVESFANICRGFEIPVVIWHSGLSTKKRRNNWAKIVSGSTRLVIGTRSAVFLPFHNIRAAIVDEEHDASYKHGSIPFYNARDMIALRGHIEKFGVLFLSATPSLETYLRVQNGSCSITELPDRFGTAKRPKMKIIDMRKERKGSILASETIALLHKNFNQNGKSLILLNRRGYSSKVSCLDCGHKPGCSNCSGFLFYIKSANVLRCRHCDSLLQAKCSCCGSTRLKPIGFGIERVAEDLKSIFQSANISYISSDASEKEIKTILNRMLASEIDILIGTKIIAKGHNFPKLTLACALDCNPYAQGKDPRAMERFWQGIEQFAGRAARFGEDGIFIAQTFYPEHPVLLAIQNNDSNSFYELEKESRKLYGLPPFMRVGLATFKSKKPNIAALAAKKGLSIIRTFNNVHVNGPFVPEVSKVGGLYSFKIMFRAHKMSEITRIADRISYFFSTRRSNIRVEIDLSPNDFF